MTAITEFTERDLRSTLNRAQLTVGAGVLVGLPLVLKAWGWRSLVLYLLGAAIAATGIFEWRQLASAIFARLEAGGVGAKPPRPIVRILLWFFLRLLAVGALLYVSLRSLGGRPIALILGLALAMIALLIEALRLFHAWSM